MSFAHRLQRWCLNSVGQSLVYHLSDVKGMSLWHDKFDEIGVSVDAAQRAVGMAGAFMLKSSELQQWVFYLYFFFALKIFVSCLNGFLVSRRKFSICSESFTPLKHFLLFLGYSSLRDVVWLQEDYYYDMIIFRETLVGVCTCWSGLWILTYYVTHCYDQFAHSMLKMRMWNVISLFSCILCCPCCVYTNSSSSLSWDILGLEYIIVWKYWYATYTRNTTLCECLHWEAACSNSPS